MIRAQYYQDTYKRGLTLKNLSFKGLVVPSQGEHKKLFRTLMGYLETNKEFLRNPPPPGFIVKGRA